MNIVLEFGLSCIFLTALLCERVSLPHALSVQSVVLNTGVKHAFPQYNHNLLSHSPMFPISPQLYLDIMDVATRSSITCHQCHHACGTITTILPVVGVPSPGPGSCLYRYRAGRGYRLLVTTATPTLTQVVSRKQGRS